MRVHLDALGSDEKPGGPGLCVYALSELNHMPVMVLGLRIPTLVTVTT